MAGEVERYLDMHPFREWDQDRWDERSAILDTAFHRTNVNFTPLVGHSMTMTEGIDWDGYMYTGGEVVPAHVNHEPIGRYQRMMGPIYVDTRQRKVRARYRYGAKWQNDVRDQMVTRYGKDTPSFITRVLEEQLADQIVGIQENLARDAYMDNALFPFLAHNGAAFDLGTSDFSTLGASADYVFDLTLLEQVALRMSYRSEDTLHQWGSYAQPVPGENFRNSVLVLATTGTFWTIWNSAAQQLMIDLRQLQDDRIINNQGGAVQYRNMVIVDTGHSMILWNAGNITKQVAVTSPIKWGDGATAPATAVDSMWYTGQSAEPTHYLQCSAFAAGAFAKGDFISVHTAQTDEYGITGGCDPLHGKTVRAEVYSVDAATDRITLRKPMTEAFEDAFTYSNLDGAAAAGQAYAIVTKAQHVHPTFVIGARECIQWVARKQPTGGFIEYNRPTDNDVDFPSVVRVTANWYGEMNPWNLDLYEVFYGAGAFANRGGLGY